MVAHSMATQPLDLYSFYKIVVVVDTASVNHLPWPFGRFKKYPISLKSPDPSLPFAQMEETDCCPGTLLRAIHPYTKTRQDELELELNDLVTLLESPSGGWARGAKNLNSKIPESGWFPMTLVEVAQDQASQIPMKSSNSLASIDSNAGEYKKRSRSVSWYNKVFIKNGLTGSKTQEISFSKGRRERSSSAPATSARSSQHFDSMMDPVLDLSDPSLNQEELPVSKELPPLVKAESSPEQQRLEADTDRPASPTRPLLSLKSSFFGPIVNDAVLKEIVYTEWSYLQDLYLLQVLFSITHFVALKNTRLKDGHHL